MADPIFTGDDEGPQPGDDPGAYEPSEERMYADEPTPADDDGWDGSAESGLPDEAPVADDSAAEQPTPAGSPEQAQSPEADETQEAVAAAEQQQATQDALFDAEITPTPPLVGSDEAVTSFGGAPNDLDAIHAELTSAEEAEAAGEGPAEEAAETGAVGGGVAAAAAAADEEAAEALAEAGVPAGDDDEPDAVEALLDAEADEGLFEPERPDRILSTPFLVYDAVWLVFVIAMVFVLRDAAVAGALDQASQYPVFVLIGLVLTVVGPLLSIVVWLVARSRTEGEGRRGLLAVSLLRGSLATFAGVAMWWAGLVLLNYFKTGRFF